MMAETLIDEVLGRLAADQRVRRQLPAGGRLYLDRRLPFLCVYRLPSDRPDAGSEQLVSTQAAYLVSARMKAHQRAAINLLRALIGAGMERFGGFLVLEIWASLDHAHETRIHEESGEPLAPRPWFSICSNPRRCPTEAVEALARSLRRVRTLRQSALVESAFTMGCGPTGLPPLLPSKEIARLGCHLVGLEVRPVYRDPLSGEVFPGVLRALRRSMGRALGQAFFAFAQTHTNIRPRHFHTLGRRSFAKAVREADGQLAAIETSFDLLLQATPTNAEAGWLEFRRRGFEAPPVFQYRPAAVEPGELKRRLFLVPLDRIEDATLAHLLRQKQDELDRKITMLGDVGTRRLLPGSMQVHGAVDDALVALANELLDRVPSRSRHAAGGRQLKAEQFAGLAREEIARYQAVDPGFRPVVEVRDDFYSGLLVSYGKLLIGCKTTVAADRVEALLQHEIGTHLVTYHNGNSQPFRQMAVGLAGYDGLQEGLAVLAEHLAGGLTRPRVRLLAARVVAVKSLLDGAGFVDTFRLLTRRHGFARRTAYTITMRVYRGGGLTKDANYLRGVVEILAYLGGGGKIEPLLAGKIAADHIPLVEELRLRHILRSPPLRPRFLDFPLFTPKLARLRSGLSPLQLLEEA